MEVISICLSDLPKEKMTVGKNGKKYINLVVDKRKEADQYGNTHTVYVNQTKEEREAKENKTYVGNGKEYLFNSQQSTPQNTLQQSQPQPSNDGDDLPF
jgi:ABC-type Fe3+-citrate transport system substrate-binding protein